MAVATGRDFQRMKASCRGMRVERYFGQKGMKKAWRGEQNAGVNAEWSDGMLRGGEGGSCDSGPGAGAHIQASPYLDYEESTTVVVAAATTRAIVTVSSDIFKSEDTRRFSTIKISERAAYVSKN
jgi:hypothetical protein